MKDKILILTDIHGCIDELTEMIQTVEHDKLYILGDLIDRGPDSLAVVEYCINNNISVCLGNHELMFIEAISDYLCTGDRLGLKFTDWWCNGGDKVFKQYCSAYDKPNKGLLQRHLEYFKSLPLYYLLESKIHNKQVLLSHSMITQYITKVNRDIGPSYNEVGDVVIPYVWNRDKLPNKSSEYFNIHGHSPTDWYAGYTEPKVYQNEYQLNLDTGCAYKDTPARGKLSGAVLSNGTVEIVQV